MVLRFGCAAVSKALGVIFEVTLPTLTPLYEHSKCGVGLGGFVVRVMPCPFFRKAQGSRKSGA